MSTPQNQTARMDEATLNAIVANEERQALGYVGKLSEQRRRALYYYHGEAVEDLAPPEVEGRSGFVSTDLMDTVEWTLPQLLRIFTSGEQIVRFDPRHWQDQQAAKQATDYVNYVFSVQNPGFLILHTMFKDALLQKAGVVKVWWDEHVEESREEYEGLTQVELGILMHDENVEVIEATRRPSVDPQTGQPADVYDVTCIRSKDASQVRVENVPPEEFLVSRLAKNIEDSPFVAHRMKRTISHLRAMGYPASKIDTISSDDQSGEFNAERLQRMEYDDEYPMQNHENLDESQREVWLTEAYLKVDWDNDGIAEWRKVVRAGAEILENEECDGPPFAFITPIMMPHRLFGLSFYDTIADVQRLKTAVTRQMLDNMYNLNNNRYAALENMVNLDDLLTNRPGGVVRVKMPGAIQPLPSEPLGPAAVQMLEYADTIRENRTGITKYNQGLDANTLNKTATGINIINNNSQARVELIARVFAETGVKDIFKLILKMVGQYQKQKQMVRLNGDWVAIDPREWKNQFDMTISVGLGTGNRDQQMAQLNQILQIQEQVGQSPYGPLLLKPDNVYNVLLKMEQTTGIKGLDAFTDPRGAQNPMPGAGNPEAQKAQQQAQMQQQQLQMEMQQKQQQLALQHQQLQQQYTLKVMELQQQAQANAQSDESKRAIEAMKVLSQQQIEREKILSDKMKHSETLKAQAQQAQAAQQQPGQDNASPSSNAISGPF